MPQSEECWDISCPCHMLQNPLQSHKSCPPALLLERARGGRQAMVLSPLWHCDTLLLTSTPRWTSPMWPQPPCPGTPQEIDLIVLLKEKKEKKFFASCWPLWSHYKRGWRIYHYRGRMAAQCVLNNYNRRRQYLLWWIVSRTNERFTFQWELCTDWH